MRNKKKAMSEVVSAVLMIVLVMSLIAVVWGVITNLVSKETKNIQSCYGNFDKISLNDAYTCYNTTAPSNGDFYFSINVGDIAVDKIFVSITSQGTSNTITLTPVSQTLINPSVTNYPSKSPGVIMPNKNSGKTYVVSGIYTSIPDSVRISAVVGGETCQESDSIVNVEVCSSY